VTPFDFGTQAAPDPGIKNWVGRPEGWMDPRAYRLYGTDLIWDAGTSTWNHPGGGATTLFRQKITVPRAGDYVLEVNGENYQVWLDGADGVSLSTRGAGAMTSRRVIDLAAGELQFAGQATNYGVMTRPSDNVSWLMWSLAEVDADGNPGEVVARSTPSTVVCVYEPDPWPGVTAGYILDVALTEDLARHAGRPWTWDFTDALDSYGQAWTTLLSHEFRMETLGRLQQELSGLLPLEVWAEADGTIRAAPRRGTDRTATVTIANPFGLDLTGEGPRLTRALYQTPAGFGATGGANESTYGVMEDVLTLGTGLDARAVRDSVVRFRNERSTPYNEASIELPDDVRPFVDVFPGDTVTVSGVGPYRLMTFELADGDSQPEWAVSGCRMPEREAARQARRWALELAELQATDSRHGRTRCATFDGSADGRFVPARPMDNSGGGSLALGGTPGQDAVSHSDPYGETVRLAFATAAGGGVLTFTALDADSRHTTVLDDYGSGLPATAVVSPIDAYWTLVLEATHDSETNVEWTSWMLLDTVRKQGRTRTTLDAQLDRTVLSGTVLAGEAIGFELALPVGVAASGWLSVHLVERPRVTVTEPAPLWLMDGGGLHQGTAAGGEFAWLNPASFPANTATGYNHSQLFPVQTSSVAGQRYGAVDTTGRLFLAGRASSDARLPLERFTAAGVSEGAFGQPDQDTTSFGVAGVGIRGGLLWLALRFAWVDTGKAWDGAHLVALDLDDGSVQQYRTVPAPWDAGFAGQVPVRHRSGDGSVGRRGRLQGQPDDRRVRRPAVEVAWRPACTTGQRGGCIRRTRRSCAR
jgi:hypothetical protein